MPTSTTDWTWTKADDPRGTANGINLGEGQFSSRQMVGQGSINYANSFGKHNVEAMVLAEIRDYKENSFSGYNKNMSFAELPELSFGQPGRLPYFRLQCANRSIGLRFPFEIRL